MSSNLSQVFFDYIDQEIIEYIRKISVDYNLNFNELVMKWRGEKPLKNFDNICPHRYTKGKMVGQRCTQKIHEGETKCSKHK